MLDEKLAHRIRATLGRRKGLIEKKMFGGMAFLLNGNMCVGVHQNDLIVRVAPDKTDTLLKDKHTRVFDLTGRPMKGWLLAALGKWVTMAHAFAESLPPK